MSWLGCGCFKGPASLLVQPAHPASNGIEKREIEQLQEDQQQSQPALEVQTHLDTSNKEGKQQVSIQSQEEAVTRSDLPQSEVRETEIVPSNPCPTATATRDAARDVDDGSAQVASAANAAVADSADEKQSGMCASGEIGVRVPDTAAEVAEDSSTTPPLAVASSAEATSVPAIAQQEQRVGASEAASLAAMLARPEPAAADSEASPTWAPNLSAPVFEPGMMTGSWEPYNSSPTYEQAPMASWDMSLSASLQPGYSWPPAAPAQYTSMGLDATTLAGYYAAQTAAGLWAQSNYQQLPVQAGYQQLPVQPGNAYGYNNPIPNSVSPPPAAAADIAKRSPSAATDPSLQSNSPRSVILGMVGKEQPKSEQNDNARAAILSLVGGLKEPSAASDRCGTPVRSRDAKSRQPLGTPPPPDTEPPKKDSPRSAILSMVGAKRQVSPSAGGVKIDLESSLGLPPTPPPRAASDRLFQPTPPPIDLHSQLFAQAPVAYGALGATCQPVAALPFGVDHGGAKRQPTPPPPLGTPPANSKQSSNGSAARSDILTLCGAWGALSNADAANAASSSTSTLPRSALLSMRPSKPEDSEDAVRLRCVETA